MRRGDRHRARLTLITNVNLDVWKARKFSLNALGESLMVSDFGYDCV